MARQPKFDPSRTYRARKRLLIAGKWVDRGETIEPETLGDRLMRILFEQRSIEMVEGDDVAAAVPCLPAAGSAPVGSPVAPGRGGSAALPDGWRDLSTKELRGLAEELTGEPVRTRKAAVAAIEGYECALAA